VRLEKIEVRRSWSNKEILEGTITLSGEKAQIALKIGDDVARQSEDLALEPEERGEQATVRRGRQRVDDRRGLGLGLVRQLDDLRGLVLVPLGGLVGVVVALAWVDLYLRAELGDADDDDE
jgi:hypothetical protein